MTMKLTKLQRILKNSLEEVEYLLEEFGEDSEIKVATNTYFVGDTTYLATTDGFVGLNCLEERLVGHDEDDEE